MDWKQLWLLKAYCGLPSKSFRDAINRITIQYTRKKIERHSGTETATRSNCRKSANEVHALHVEQFVEIVVLWYEDLVAIGIFLVWQPTTAFFRIVSVQRVCKHNDSRKR